MLPNWIGIGSARAGTTSLYHIVQQHPDIFIPTQKETGFFNKKHVNESKLAYYETIYFQNVGSQKSIGEITPTYMFDENAIKNIFKALGKAKIITNLRNPIDRAYSHYLFNIKHITEGRPFYNAMTAMTPENKDDYIGEYDNNYINMGLYSKPLAKYIDLFGKKNIFNIIFEQDLKVGNPDFSKNLFNFLEVEDVPVEIAHSNKSPKLDFRYFEKEEEISVLGKDNLETNVIMPAGSLALLNSVWGDWNVFIKKPSRNLIERFNATARSYLEKPNDEIKKELTERYFLDDIRKTEYLLDIDLSHWYK